MAEKKVNNYEGMFLLSQAAGSDLPAAVEHIREILTKGGAEIIALQKWDERRLAFEIEKQKRGVYILVYFSCPTEGLETIERACNLSEQILRQLIIRADHLTLDQMKAADKQDVLHAAAETGEEAKKEKGDGEATEPVGAASEGGEQESKG